MFQTPLTVPVIGADFKNARGKARQAAIAQCRPGEGLTLRRERCIVQGRAAVGVYTVAGDQIGYVYPEWADEVAANIKESRAIFKAQDSWGAVAIFSFDGIPPTLPSPPPPRKFMQPVEPMDEFCDIFPDRQALTR